MKLVLLTDHLAVYDEVFPPDEWTSVQTWAGSTPYHLPFVGSPARPDRLTDGAPYEGEEYRPDDAPPLLLSVFDHVREVARRHPEVAGTEGRDWIRLRARPYVYPRGVRLGWHNDYDCSAAAILYLHPVWGATWGGELMFARTPETVENRHLKGGPFQTWTDLFVGEIGCGVWVAPKPNRLVLSAGNEWHMINRVDADAGSHVRSSLSVFLLKPDQTGESSCG